jgi:hypothetical protein
MYLKQFPLKRPWLLITGVVLGAILFVEHIALSILRL